MVEHNSLAIMLEFSELPSMVAKSKMINATTLGTVSDVRHPRCVYTIVRSSLLGTVDILIPLPLLVCVW